MAFVVTESRIKCQYTRCVDVCPIDAFREGPNFPAIEPDDGINCMLWVVECPVDAIFAEDDVPQDLTRFIALNLELARSWKPIVNRKAAAPDADEWARIKDKYYLLMR